MSQSEQQIGSDASSSGPTISIDLKPDSEDTHNQTMSADLIPDQGTSSLVQPTAQSSALTGGVQVYGPAITPAETSSVELDEGYFEPTLNEVQAHHASVLARSRQLNEGPLLTAKYRDAERQEREKKKADKWPNATIRIKFSDGTIVQNTFPSTSAIQPVYAFVRSTLDPSVADKPFMLWQPPKTQYPEHPPVEPKKVKLNTSKTPIIPPANYGHVKGALAQGLQNGTGGTETLAELGLVPQSVLLIKWEGEEGMNASGYPAPLKGELQERRVPLPPAVPVTSVGEGSSQGAAVPGQKQEKKIPKWLQKGLLKKK